MPDLGWSRHMEAQEDAAERRERERTAREHCHCDREDGPCSVCRARGQMVANDD